jgi:hypothetical protein
MNEFIDRRSRCVRTRDVCPICHEAPAAEISHYLALEEEGFAERVFALIRVFHCCWREEHGACAMCWNFYVNLVRALYAMGSLRDLTLERGEE